MFRNYFKVGIRNIFKYKVFSLINVFGLAVAMSVCMLIMLMLADQKSYDQFHTKKDRVFRIISEPKNAKYATTPIPLANTLNSNYSQIEASTQLIQGVGGDIAYDQNMAEVRGFFADTAFFQVFSFALKKGNENLVLASPNTMVITQALADRLFKAEDPIGKTVEFTDRGLPMLGDGPGTPPVAWGLYTITGVIAAEKYKSHLNFDVLISVASMSALYATEKITDRTGDWSDYFRCYTYALLYPDHDQQELDGLLNALAKRAYIGIEDQEGFNLSTQAITKITPGPMLGNPSNFSLPLIAYYILSVLAFIIMLSACLNYTNLSIARALTRSKEIGVRKVTGAQRKDLIYQFLSESLLMTFFALLLAFILLVLLKPAFMSLWVNQYLNFDLQENLSIYAVFIGFAIAIGLFAGFYPAIHLSGFRPLKVLKSNGSTLPGKLGMRKILSTSQFIISLFFIVTSLLIFNQFKHFLAFNYGFNAARIINIPLQGNNYQLVANELNSVAGVATISASEYLPATGTVNGTSLAKAGAAEDDYTFFISLPVGENFTNNLGIELVAGKNLPETPTSSNRFILVNEAAVRALDYENPTEILGLGLKSKWSEENLEVIGVVKDFRIDLPMNRDEIRPMILRNQPDLFRYANVKIASTNLVATVEGLEDKWEKIDPIHPFKYEFYDQQLAATNQGIFDVVSIIGFIAFLAITVACLGMLGMAIYTTERYTKEIGIRKVLGAENFSITLLLSKSFLKILGVSVFIGAPLSYFLNNLWLQYLPNRVDFGLGTVLLGTLLLLVLGLLTICSQTIRAAQRNPVDTLRNE